jgi:hypothetical protein
MRWANVADPPPPPPAAPPTAATAAAAAAAAEAAAGETGELHYVSVQSSLRPWLYTAHFKLGLALLRQAGGAAGGGGGVVGAGGGGVSAPHRAPLKAQGLELELALEALQHFQTYMDVRCSNRVPTVGYR